MCGIIGYVGAREAKPLLLQGLRRLEYRGYDSAGIALREDAGLDYVRAVGNLQNLVDAAGPNGSVSRQGLGHTRWATHGGVTEANAHLMAEEGRVPRPAAPAPQATYDNDASRAVRPLPAVAQNA